MKKVCLLAVAAALTLQAETLCGKKYSTQEVDVFVACVDVAALNRLGVPMVLPGSPDTITQFFITSRIGGRALEVTLDGKTQLTRLVDNQGSPMGLVVFDGMDHTELPEIVVLDKK